MAKSQKKFLAAPVTLEQIAQLLEWRGQTQAEIFAIAIDALWRQENKRRNPPACETCGTKYNYFAYMDKFIQQCDCD